jgi:hypothetical protein
MIYTPEAVWSGANPPWPAFLMQELHGLYGNPEFPFVNCKVFAARVDTIIRQR